MTTLSFLSYAKEALPDIEKAWARVTKQDERDAALRLVVYMETKRIFDRTAIEMPYACYRSVEEIMKVLQDERADLPRDEFLDASYQLVKICNDFKTQLDDMGLSESKQYDYQLSDSDKQAFINALKRFRFQIGITVFARQRWGVSIPAKLVPDDAIRSLFPDLKVRHETSLY